jgi:hypothetical protein
VWAYDGRRNIYAAKLFLPQHESVFKVKACKNPQGMVCEEQVLFSIVTCMLWHA